MFGLPESQRVANLMMPMNVLGWVLPPRSNCYSASHIKVFLYIFILQHYYATVAGWGQYLKSRQRRGLPVLRDFWV